MESIRNPICGQEEHKELVENASAIVSLYGDEATTPCLQYVGPRTCAQTLCFRGRAICAVLGAFQAAIAKAPCVVIPCNECVPGLNIQQCIHVALGFRLTFLA